MESCERLNMSKGMVSKKEKKFRMDYQDYLETLRKQGRSALRKAKTQYEWRQSTARTRQIEKQKARS